MINDFPDTLFGTFKQLWTEKLLTANNLTNDKKKRNISHISHEKNVLLQTNSEQYIASNTISIDKSKQTKSGGLTPDTVAEAVLATGATQLDVSSGVEAAPGQKDPSMIEAFLKAAETV